MVYIGVGLPGGQPLFPLVGQFLAEGQLNRFIVLLVGVHKLDLMLIKLGEVVLGLFGCGSTQTFVVFDLVAFKVSAARPQLKLRNGEEGVDFISFGCLDDWRDEFFDKSIHL